MPEEWKTANLALAAFLSFQKIDPLRMDWEDGTCFWYFKDGEELQALVAAFTGGQERSRVEARAYSYKITQFRKDMRGVPR